MPERKYIIWIADNIKCIVQFITEKGVNVGFVVRLTAIINGKKYEIRRYDTAHGIPHIDVLNLKGKTIEKIWIPQLPPGEAMTFAIKDIKTNFEAYIRRFIK